MGDMGILAKEMLNVYLAYIILGRDLDANAEEIFFWAYSFLRSELGDDTEAARRAENLAREILAYSCAYRRLEKSPAGNPKNVIALLIYNISHSGRKDVQRNKRWEQHLSQRNGTFNLPERLDTALEFIEELRGAFLSEEAVSKLMGWRVNLDRVARIVQEEYENLKKEGTEGDH